MVTKLNTNTWLVGETRVLWKDMPVTQSDVPTHRTLELLNKFGLTWHDCENPEIMFMINLCLHSCPNEGPLEDYFMELVHTDDIPYAGMRFLRYCVECCMLSWDNIPDSLLKIVNKIGNDDLNFCTQSIRQFMFTHPGDLLRTDLVSAKRGTILRNTDTSFNFEKKLAPVEKYACILCTCNDIEPAEDDSCMRSRIMESSMNDIEKMFCVSMMLGVCADNKQHIWTSKEKSDVLSVIGEYTGIKSWSAYNSLIQFVNTYLHRENITEDEFLSIREILKFRRSSTQVQKDVFVDQCWNSK